MPRKRSSPPPLSNDGSDTGQQQPLEPGILITFRPGAMQEGVNFICAATGTKDVAFAADFADGAVDLAQVRRSGLLVMNTLGVAVADLDPDQRAGLSAASGGGTMIAAIEPEPIFFAFADGLPPELSGYLRGYRAAVEQLCEAMTGSGAARAAGLATAAVFRDDAVATWGLQATRTPASRFSGRGARIAVLDTGLDLDHPDFQGRQVTSRSFIPGETAQDGNGHGTHCTGTACGTRSPARGPRYGIAHEAEIFIGKVLSDQGSSLGRSTIAGIEWAVTTGCHIISMSLGGAVAPGQPFLQAFERIALEALRRNALIIAAAGNESRRSIGRISPVGSPANCPSIMAVAAIDPALRVADFSNGSVNPDGRVDICGPGSDVYSSAPEPAAAPQPPFFRQWSSQYDTISGTSMATPHVAGIAALYREERPDLAAADLWRLLTARALPLPIPAGDVGAGLVQA